MKDSLRHGVLRGSLFVASLCLLSQQAGAAAFALKEQSVAYLGSAFAGSTSSAEDASTSFYNPAGMVELPNSQAVLGGTWIDAKIKLKNATATNTGGVTAVGGNNPTVPKSRAFIPNGHLVWKASNRWAFGLSLCAPFGLSTIYSNTDIARYRATESKIKTVDISPTAALRINNKFSIGVGLDPMHVKATLASDVNVGLGEGYVINKASGWSFGYHAGVLFKPSAFTKMGLVYFSKFDPKVDGTVTSFRFPAAVVPTTLTSQVHLPERIVYGLTHKYNDQWTGMGEIEWIHWSRFKLVRLKYNTGAASTEQFFYKNSYRFSLGANYQYSQPLILKGGLAFDQTPIHSRFRSPRLPDADRYWLTVGAKYNVNKNLSLDAAYAHLFIKKANVDLTGAPGGLRGNYRSSANLVGVQLTWNFI